MGTLRKKATTFLLQLATLKFNLFKCLGAVLAHNTRWNQSLYFNLADYGLDGKFFRKDQISNEKKTSAKKTSIKKPPTEKNSIAEGTISSSEDHIAFFLRHDFTFVVNMIYLYSSIEYVSSHSTWSEFLRIWIAWCLMPKFIDYSIFEKKRCRIAFSQLNWMEFIGCQRCSIRSVVVHCVICGRLVCQI